MRHITLLLFLVLFSTKVSARGPATGEIMIYLQAGSEETLFGQEIFSDFHATDVIAVFGRAYHDDESWIATFGLETCLFNDALKIGIAGGGSGDDHEVNPVISPSIYYHDERTVFLLLFEQQLAGGWDTFYRVYIQQKVYRDFVGGAYGDKNVGWGPTVGIEVSEHATIFANVPVAERPQGDDRIIVQFIANIYF